MPISHEHKAIFIHIPKNAGSSIELSMGMQFGDMHQTLWGVFAHRIVLQHLTAAELKDNYVSRDIWDSYLKFAVVRNPWSKAVSEYNWYTRYGPTVPFYEWVRSLAARLKANSCIHIEEFGHNVEQYKFICEEKLLVDEVLYFENISLDFSCLCKRMNWNVSLGHTDTTKSLSSLDFREYYCEESAEIIGEVYKKDIEIFDYDLNKTFAGHEISNRPKELLDLFDPVRYLELNQDVRYAGVDPLEHYLIYGEKEGRRIR